MEIGPQNQIKDGLLGPNSIMVVCMDPLGLKGYTPYLVSQVLAPRFDLPLAIFQCLDMACVNWAEAAVEDNNRLFARHGRQNFQLATPNPKP